MGFWYWCGLQDHKFENWSFFPKSSRLKLRKELMNLLPTKKWICLLSRMILKEETTGLKSNRRKGKGLILVDQFKEIPRKVMQVQWKRIAKLKMKEFSRKRPSLKDRLWRLLKNLKEEDLLHGINSPPTWTKFKWRTNMIRKVTITSSAHFGRFHF